LFDLKIRWFIGNHFVFIESCGTVRKSLFWVLCDVILVIIYFDFIISHCKNCWYIL